MIWALVSILIVGYLIVPWLHFQHKAQITRVRKGAVRNINLAEQRVSAIRSAYEKTNQKLVDQIIELARPQSNIPQMIEAIGESVAKVAYGPDRKPLTKEEVASMTYNPVQNLNETLGGRPGEWLPDVELDEWMEEHGIPSRPGQVAGTGPPQMPSAPGDDLLPPGVIGLASNAPPNGQRFSSGVTGPPPRGGVE